MAFTIGANPLSLTIQRNLGRATADLSTSSERLSSGLRINKASDDAAGLAITSSLNAASRVSAQGVRNLNDGISAINVAEAALSQLGDIVQRIEELSTQAMSDTFSETQRSSMQREVTAIQAEWNRIIESTTFNGINLLTGNSTRVVLQGGTGSEGTLAVQTGEATAGALSRISVSSGGAEANGASTNVGLSYDGRYVTFHSAATNLVAGDTNGTEDVFLRDMLLGTTTRVSTTSSGAEGTGSSTHTNHRSITNDGRYVVFTSLASNLVAGDSNGEADIFRKDMQTGDIIRVNTTSTGAQATGGASTVAAISPDGRYIAFSSAATNLVANDTNGAIDIFVKDTLTGGVVRASTDSSGNQATGASAVPVFQMSTDGRYVVFSSEAGDLVTGDTNGVADIFRKDLLTGRTQLVSASSSGTPATLASSAPRISDDAQYILFSSSDSGLVSGDTNGTVDAFMKDMSTGTLVRVSTNASGQQVTGDSNGSSVSADGRYVTFRSTATNLVTGDTNGLQDIFRKDLQTGIVQRLTVSDSGLEGNVSTNLGSVSSADGRYIVFASGASNLVANDTNGTTDIFFKDMTTVGVQQMSGMLITNRGSAAITLSLAQRYREEIQEYRGQIGASLSRAGTYLNTLRSAELNYRAASAQIAEADVAAEAANSIKARILQQTAASLLGQANQAPKIALSLLQT